MERRSTTAHAFDWKTYRIEVIYHQKMIGGNTYTFRIMSGQKVLANSDTAYAIPEEAARDALLWLLENRSE